MRAVICPEVYERQDGDIVVFMAGGITNCADWQSVMIPMYKDVDVVLINPRRPNFDVRDPSLSEQQIAWEHEHLEMADAVSFWFTSETLCPISLFELGKCLGLGRKVFVATHPQYARREDVVHQTRLMVQGQVVHDNMNDLVKEVSDWVDRKRKFR